MYSENSQMVVATLKAAVKINGELKLDKNGNFNRELHVVEKTAKVVKRIWAEEFNTRASQSGKWYDFDEEATEKFYVKVADAKKARDKAQEVSEAAGELLVDAVKTIKKVKKQ